MSLQKPKCLVPSCTNLSRCRGLCHKHYVAMNDGVRSGKYDTLTLEKSGAIAPVGAKRGESPQEFSQWAEACQIKLLK